MISKGTHTVRKEYRTYDTTVTVVYAGTATTPDATARQFGFNACIWPMYGAVIVRRVDTQTEAVQFFGNLGLAAGLYGKYHTAKRNSTPTAHYDGATVTTNTANIITGDLREEFDPDTADLDITHDFGNGPVPAHRHTNPDGSLGGWVANTARVQSGSYVDEYAKVFDTAQITHGTILQGTTEVCRSACVQSSHLVDCIVRDEALVTSSYVAQGCTVQGQAKVLVTVLPAGTLVEGGAVVHNADHIRDDNQYYLCKRYDDATVARVSAFSGTHHRGHIACKDCVDLLPLAILSQLEGV